MRIKFSEITDNGISFLDDVGKIGINIKHLTCQFTLNIGNDILKYSLLKTRLTIQGKHFDYRKEMSSTKEKKLYNLLRELHENSNMSVVKIDVKSTEEKIDININFTA